MTGRSDNKSSRCSNRSPVRSRSFRSSPAPIASPSSICSRFLAAANARGERGGFHYDHPGKDAFAAACPAEGAERNVTLSFHERYGGTRGADECHRQGVGGQRRQHLAIGL